MNRYLHQFLCAWALLASIAANAQNTGKKTGGDKGSSKTAELTQANSSSNNAPERTWTLLDTEGTLHRFVIDMEGLSVSKPPPLGRGDFYVVEVKGLNSNLYKVQLDSEELFSTESLAFPTFAGVSMDGIKDLLAGLKTKPDAAAQSADIQKAASSGGSNSPAERNVMTEKGERFNAALAKAKQDLEVVLNMIPTLNSKIIKWYFDAQVSRLDYLRLTQDKSEGQAPTHMTLDSLVARSIRLDSTANSLRVILKAARENYLNATERDVVVNAILSLDSYKKEHQGMLGRFDEVAKNVEELNAAATNEKISFSLIALLDLDNAKGGRFTTIPRPYEGGDVEFQVTITPRDEKSNLPSYATGPMRWPTKRKPYFAVGPSFYASDLYDQNVSIGQQKTGDSLTYTLYNEPRSTQEFGAALKFMGGVQLGPNSDFGAHLFVGPGISITDPVKPRLLFGAGLSYGRQHRIVVDFGGIIGPVERRRQSFQNDEGYTVEPTDVTTNRVLNGWHLSLGYVFLLRTAGGEKKKENAPAAGKETEKPKKEEAKEDKKEAKED